MQSSRYEEGVPFVNRMYRKVLPFLCKKLYKRVMGWTSGRSFPVWYFFNYPRVTFPPPRTTPLPRAGVLFVRNRITTEALITNLFQTYNRRQNCWDTPLPPHPSPVPSIQSWNVCCFLKILKIARTLAQHCMEHWNLQTSIDPRRYLQQKSAKKKQRWKQDAFEDTVKPLYNAPVYSGHPEYYGHQTTSRNFQLPYIFCI